MVQPPAAPSVCAGQRPAPSRKVLTGLFTKGSHSAASDSVRPMDCSLPGSSVHGIFQARVLEWGAMFHKLCLYLFAALGPSPAVVSGAPVHCCARAREWRSVGLVAWWHMGSSQTRDGTHGPCIGRPVLICCTTREARKETFCPL